LLIKKVKNKRPVLHRAFFTSINTGMNLRPANTRGYHLGDLTGEPRFESYRSFDFESFQSGVYLNWGPIITINDDRAQPGFITRYHEHKKLDILSYVVKGQVHHKDNLGNELQAQAGQVQHMSCGTGIWHTEGNISEASNRYLQIWIMSNQLVFDWQPKYTLITREANFCKLPVELKNTKLEIWSGNLEEEYSVDCLSYLLVLEGSCSVDEFNLQEGDALEITGPVTIGSKDRAHVILFKLKR
jgi:quercetin 2,3-dioxygenase